jgi:hypothetical protein
MFIGVFLIFWYAAAAATSAVDQGDPVVQDTGGGGNSAVPNPTVEEPQGTLLNFVIG